MIRFAILKEIKGTEEEKIVIEYDSEMIKNRLVNITIENLPNLKFSISEKSIRGKISKAVMVAWESLVKEFKNETVKLK